MKYFAILDENGIFIENQMHEECPVNGWEIMPIGFFDKAKANKELGIYEESGNKENLRPLAVSEHEALKIEYSDMIDELMKVPTQKLARRAITEIPLEICLEAERLTAEYHAKKSEIYTKYGISP